MSLRVMHSLNHVFDIQSQKASYRTEIGHSIIQFLGAASEVLVLVRRELFVVIQSRYPVEPEIEN